MSTRGTPNVPLRLSPATVARIDAEVARLNSRRRKNLTNRSDFIRMAIEERLDKLDRGRRGKARKRQEEGTEAQVSGSEDVADATSEAGSSDAAENA